MSDLISRSALIELIQKDIEKTASFMNTAKKYDGSFDKLYGQLNTLRNYKSIISDIPTAYDVEKVVAELPTYEFGVSLLNTEKYVKLSDLKKKIDAIRKGGVE